MLESGGCLRWGTKDGYDRPNHRDQYISPSREARRADTQLALGGRQAETHVDRSIADRARRQPSGTRASGPDFELESYQIISSNNFTQSRTLCSVRASFITVSHFVASLIHIVVIPSGFLRVLKCRKFVDVVSIYRQFKMWCGLI